MVEVNKAYIQKHHGGHAILEQIKVCRGSCSTICLFLCYPLQSESVVHSHIPTPVDFLGSLWVPAGRH